MKRELCIFDHTKACNDCGECDNCDLNPSVTCNNCGKCLQDNGTATKAIKIASIIENEEDAVIIENIESGALEEDLALDLEDYDDETLDEELEEDEVSINNYILDEVIETNSEDSDFEFIEDIEGLSEILEGIDKVENGILEEVFPGFYRIKKN